jgi:hypothetical protein
VLNEFDFVALAEINADINLEWATNIANKIMERVHLNFIFSESGIQPKTKRLKGANYDQQKTTTNFDSIKRYVLFTSVSNGCVQ